MTQDQKTLFQVQLQKVSASASSIFSKADVISILEELQDTMGKLPVQTPTIGYSHDAIVRAFNDMLDEYDFEEFVSFEPELQGSYGSSYSLEISHSFDEPEFRRCIINDLQNYFAPNKEEL